MNPSRTLIPFHRLAFRFSPEWRLLSWRNATFTWQTDPPGWGFSLRRLICTFSPCTLWPDMSPAIIPGGFKQTGLVRMSNGPGHFPLSEWCGWPTIIKTYVPPGKSTPTCLKLTQHSAMCLGYAKLRPEQLDPDWVVSPSGVYATGTLGTMVDGL